MWSSSRAARVLAVLIGLSASLSLAGCSGLSPVYGDRGIASQHIDIAYAAPSNRLEQIIYQDLALRLGKASASATAPKLTVGVSRSVADLTGGVVTSPYGQKQVTVTASIRLEDADGKIVFTGSRSQSADYTSAASSLANQQAAEDAAQRAARLLADTIRLTVLGALMR